MPASETSLPGDLGERFVVTGLLGAGAFGRVLEVEPRDGGPRQALKLLPVEGDGARERRELEASLALDHPNVLTTFEVGVTAGEAWLLMERADGNLRPLLDEARRTRDADLTQRIWEHLREVARGLSAMAAAGMIHRDLKPENVLLVGGVAKLGDLGLAKGGLLETVTSTGVILGTPQYMSPEQARGEKLTPATDAYSLGIMFHELLEGTIPGDHGSPVDRVLHRGRGPTPTLTRERLAPDVRAEVLRLLDPDPAARPALLDVWADSLGPFAVAPGGDPPAAETVVLGRAPVAAAETSELAPPRRGLWPLAMFGLVPLILAGLAGSPSPPPPSPFPSPRPEKTHSDFARELQGNLKRELEDAEAAGFVSEDPARWGELVGELPTLKKVYEMMGAGFRTDFLDASSREIHASTDRLFLERGLPAPLRPFLEVRPLQEEVSFQELTEHGPDWIERNDLVLPGTVAGWTGRAVEIYGKLLRRKRARSVQASEMLEGREPPGVPVRVADVFMRDNVLYRTSLEAQNPFKGYRVFWGQARYRAALDRWMGGRDDVQAFLHCIGRALTEEPETREGLALFVYEAATNLRPFYFTGPFDLDPGLQMGVPLTTPAHHFAATRFYEEHAKTLTHQKERADRAWQSHAEHLRGALADLEDGTAVPRRRHRNAFRGLVSRLARRSRHEEAAAAFLRVGRVLIPEDPESLLIAVAEALEAISRSPELPWSPAERAEVVGWLDRHRAAIAAREVRSGREDPLVFLDAARARLSD